MKKNLSINILEGNYNPETARQLILSCVNEQIKFFNRQLLRFKMYSRDTSAVETEIEKLELKRRQLLAYFKLTDEADENLLTMKTVIKITL